jgi:ABC-type nitrate/sulfonate/bicarbonate transport system permease component
MTSMEAAQPSLAPGDPKCTSAWWRRWRMQSAPWSTIVLILLVIGLPGLWELSSRFGVIDRRLLPPFSATMEILWKLLGDRDFLIHFGATALRIAVAFSIGAPLAILTGFFLGERLHLGRVLNPVIYFALAVPQSVFLPLFMLIFGIGFMQKVIFGITHVFFILCVTTIAAVRSIPRQYIKGAQSYGASAGQIYRHIYFPSMLPLLLNGLRMGMIFNITGVLLAEMYSSSTGLGSLIFHWGESYQMAEMLAVVLLISIITIAFNEVMRAWEAAVSGWNIRGATA